jgi:hypothetical protein
MQQQKYINCNWHNSVAVCCNVQASHQVASIRMPQLYESTAELCTMNKNLHERCKDLNGFPEATLDVIQSTIQITLITYWEWEG